jgi:hypothetical protein
LDMHHTATKFVPLLLTNDQKQWYVEVHLELWEKANKVTTFIAVSLCFSNWKWKWRDDNNMKENDFHAACEACGMWWDPCTYSQGDGSQNWASQVGISSSPGAFR